MAYSQISSTTVPAPSASQTNFSFVVIGTMTALKTVGNGGSVQNTVSRVGVTCPADFVLSLSNTGSPALSFDFVKYDQTTGAYEIWFKIASWTASFTLYALWGDAAVVTYQGGAQGTAYDASTIRAYHFPDGTTLSLRDFSANDATATNSGATAITGQVDGGVGFDGSSTYIIPPVAGMPSGNTARTLEGWVNFNGTYTGFNLIWGYGASGATQLFGFYLDQTTHHLTSWCAGTGGTQDTGVILTNNTWTHLAQTYDTFNIRCYVNGVLVLTYPASCSTTLTSFNIGRSFAAVDYFHGSVDEFMVSSSARAAAWLLDRTNNQSSQTALNPPAAGSTVANSLTLTGCV